MASGNSQDTYCDSLIKNFWLSSNQKSAACFKMPYLYNKMAISRQSSEPCSCCCSSTDSKKLV